MDVKFIVTCDSDPKAVSDASVSIIVAKHLGAYQKHIPIAADGTASTRLADRHTTIRLEHPTLFSHPWYRFDHKPNQAFTFSLHEIGTIRGRVIQKGTDRGAADVRMQVAADGREITSAYTNERGEFEVEVPDFQVSIGVQPTRDGKWETETGQQSVLVGAGESITIDSFLVQSKGPSQGIVMLPSRQRVDRAIVLSGMRDTLSRTDDEGEFQIEFAPSRTTFVQALHPTKRLSAVVVVDRNEKNFDVGLGQEGVTYGIVVGPNGKPLANVPVTLSASAQSRTGGTRSVLRQTRTREDGTFRFLGLSPGLRYRAEVRGKTRASHSDTHVSHGKFRFSDQPVERDPIHVDEELYEEIRELSRADRVAFKTFVAPNGKDWFNSKPLQKEDYQGKSVLVCLGSSPFSFRDLQVAHELYSPMGLMVIGVVRPSGDSSGSDVFENVKANDIGFPVVVGGGELFAQSGMTRSIKYWLFRPDGSFHSELDRSPILEVRSYMLYEHPTE